MDEEAIQAKKREVWEAIDRLEPRLVELADRIHKNPELQFEEFKASQWLCGAAEEAGFEIEKPIGGLDTAFRATFGAKHGGSGPVVAFLAEYDALPEIGHACGHNLIGTASLGAALGVARAIDDIPGIIQFIGTPAEEGGGGKVILAEVGLFKGVDAAMMFHPSRKTVLWKHALARHKLSIEFFGKAAHASGSVTEGINALDATIQTFNSINALRQYITSDARIHGIITDGGKAPNIIPDYSSSLFYIRALDNVYCNELLEKVKNCAQGASAATGTRVKMEVLGSYRSLKKNSTLIQAFQGNLEALGWRAEDDDPKERIGSTDMGDVSHEVPAIHPYLKIGTAGMAGHSIEFAKAANSKEGREAMIVAAKALAATGVDVLLDISLYEKMKKEFAETKE